MRVHAFAFGVTAEQEKLYQAEDIGITAAKLRQLSCRQQVLDVFNLGFLAEVDKFLEVCTVQPPCPDQEVRQKFLHRWDIGRFWL